MKTRLLKNLATIFRRATPNNQVNVIGYPPDFLGEDIDIIQKVRPYTMTSVERVNELLRSVSYIIKNKIEGDIVECGVWRGGSMMAVAYKLMSLYHERDLYCFDTYEGMSSPSSADVSSFGEVASHYLETTQKNEDDPVWAYSPLEKVRENLKSTSYNSSKIHFIKGKVEETLPHDRIKKIALLRLDTDWYESTKHELEILFPLLSVGGIIIIDDYGHWEGAKKAVDEFIDKYKVQIFLSRVDYTCRLGVKLK
jgi:O-methyltransferase